jgi:hypothetical protein
LAGDNQSSSPTISAEDF